MIALFLVPVLLLGGNERHFPAGAPGDDLDLRIRRAIDKEFGEFLSDKRRAFYARKISVVLRQAGSPAERSKLLEDFPRTLDYHKGILMPFGGFRDSPTLPSFELPAAFLAQGAENELSYLVIRVSRAVRRKITPETRKAIEEQIDRIMKEGKRLVKLHAPDRAKHPEVDTRFDGLAKAWKASIDAPYNANLDRPIEEKQLKDVLAGMERAASQAAEKPAPEGKFGVVWPAVREATYRAVTHCFSEYAPAQAKSDAWRKKRDDRFKEWIKGLGGRVVEDENR